MAGWMLLRSQGCVWALPSSAVLSVAVEAAGCLVRLGSLTLYADEVLRVQRDLAVLPCGPLLRWAAPAGAVGLAASDHGPLVVVDPERPPELLIHHGEAGG